MVEALVERLEEGVVRATSGQLRGASIGFTVAAAGDTVDSLLERAGAAMYEVKRTRRSARP